MKPALGESLWPSCWLYQNFPFSYIGRPLDGHSSGYPFSPKFLNPPRPRLFNNWFVKTTSPCMSQWCLKDLGLNTIKKKSSHYVLSNNWTRSLSLISSKETTWVTRFILTKIKNIKNLDLWSTQVFPLSMQTGYKQLLLDFYTLNWNHFIRLSMCTFLFKSSILEGEKILRLITMSCLVWTPPLLYIIFS